ncbi:family 43 glycosylhydrolase [Pedobacter agri]|uniref:family 43 glycosylhydrolase n=1 Tax=Pedobacter agri TaxID=454586 RepID=UPI0029310241|nr:family 43 glycosylhydrolase [Pedobacter agri]
MCCFINCYNAQSQVQAAKSKFQGYLFTYFEGTGEAGLQEQLRFAVSGDAVNWVALNENRPVLSSVEISNSGGIRDPHLLRDELNENFLLTATDMFTIKNGWDKNTGIVMLKSKDLVSWTNSKVDLAQRYPEKFGHVQWVWAPQTIYDPKVGKYLVYFTVKFRNDDKLDFYGAYANKSFTGFEKPPRLLFSPKFGGIDGDIVLKDNLYHFFYKGNTKEGGKEIKNGIQQATSKSLWGVWKEDFKYLDAYADKGIAVEGSSVFKLNNASDYVLMYDIYTKGKYEFQTSTDLKTFNRQPRTFNKNFNPRHGSIIGITSNEARRLNRKWGGVPGNLLQPADSSETYTFRASGNPVIKHHYTADPSAMVDGDKLFLYAGHDFQGRQTSYVMKDWLVFSTSDMKTWEEYAVPLRIADFTWAKSGDAFAGHVAKRDNKYYWYVSTNWSGIGVAVSENPQGPFKDALGKPLLINKDCFASNHAWACIDPAVYIDDDSQAWIFWGNRECYYAKLKRNMIEIDGEIQKIDFDGFKFTEAPWVHKRNGIYYLSYATGFPERIAYATSKNIQGPWKYRGILNEIAGNSNTNHQAILDFKGQSYFIYHNGALQNDGGSYSRSVCIDKLFYDAEGKMHRIIMTSEGP